MITQSALDCPDLLACMIFSLISFSLSIFVSIAQFYQVFKTKNTSGVSVGTYIFFWVGGLMCFLWALFYYYKTLYSHEPAEMSDTGYGPYWLWQWGIIPVIGYYTLDMLMSSALIVNKIYHVRLAKKLKMNEIELSDYLRDKQWKKFLKSFKLHRRKYFWFVIYLTFAFAAVAVEMWAIATFVRPQYNPDFDPLRQWTFVPILNFVSSIIWEAISWPQFIKCIRNKDTSGISIAWAALLPTTMTISFTYALILTLATGAKGGVPLDTLGALIFNGLIVNYGVLIMKIKNIRKAKKRKMNETDYTEKYIIPKVEKEKKKQAAKLARKKEIEEAKKAREEARLQKKLERKAKKKKKHVKHKKSSKSKKK